MDGRQRRERCGAYCLALGTAVVIVAAVAGAALAAELHCPSTEPVPLSALLLPPACDDCDETRGELAELLTIQRSRTQQLVEHVEKDKEKSVGRFLGEINVNIREDQLGMADGFFECIAKVVSSSVSDAKLKFKRTRPYQLLNNGLNALKAQSDEEYSYPSGHATYGTVVGLILADMLPERREEIYKRVQDYGFSRMAAGLHFRSDVYAGQLAGAAIVASLYRNEEFRRAFEDAKIDLRRAAGY